MKKKVDTVIVSDVHLGSKRSRAGNLAKILKNEFTFERLVNLGDIFDDLGAFRFRKDQYKFLNFLYKLRVRGEASVIWVEGNHDYGLTEIFGPLLGIRVRREYQWEYNGEKFLAIHGDQFDEVIQSKPDGVHRIAKMMSFFENSSVITNVADRVERKIDKWQRLSEKVALGACEYAKKLGANVVFCGHTHEPRREKHQGIQYYNTGCWTRSPSSLVTIGEAGIQHHYYE